MLVILLTVYNHFIEPTITKLISLVSVQKPLHMYYNKYIYVFLVKLYLLPHIVIVL